MKLEADYKCDKGNGTSTRPAYTVEARSGLDGPIQAGTQIFDNKWRKVSFDKVLSGVPPCSRYDREIAEHGMLSYSAAQALRWWLHAELQANELLNGIGLETRLVKHTLETKYEIRAESCHEHIHGDDRSNIMPDWGNKSTDGDKT